MAYRLSPPQGPLFFLNTCMICMHGWKCVRMCVHICMFSCAHAWGGQRTTSGVVLRNIVHLLWDRVLPLAWSSPIRLDCWPRGPRDPCVSAFQHWDYRADSASCRPWDSYISDPSQEELALFLIGEQPPNTLPYTPTPALGKADWSQWPTWPAQLAPKHTSRALRWYSTNIYLIYDLL